MEEPDKKEPTKEQLDAYRQNRHTYCDELLPLLRKEAELAELQFKVDNFYLNRRIVQSKLAEMDAPEENKESKK